MKLQIAAQVYFIFRRKACTRFPFPRLCGTTRYKEFLPDLNLHPCTVCACAYRKKVFDRQRIFV
ncbi:MAG: hypothetical protein L6V93_09320 [Clostridiales bacterium]|nr:MAG: hypothetical protein L6V93_09320 [Clostridiales bacterium]